MGFYPDSDSIVIRVTTERLRKLAKAARKCNSILHGHEVLWMLSILDGLKELDVTELLKEDSEAFPPWIRSKYARLWQSLWI